MCGYDGDAGDAAHVTMEYYAYAIDSSSLACSDQRGQEGVSQPLVLLGDAAVYSCSAVPVTPQ